MNLSEMLHDGAIPQIGIGPGGLGYTAKYSKKGKLVKLGLRVYNKLIGRKLLESNYVNAVCNALQMGYRLIDYSSAYGSGELIGRAVKKSGIPREELFITTRVSFACRRTIGTQEMNKR